MFKAATRAYNSCSSSIELGAQHVWPHQATIKKKKRPHLKDVCLPVVHVMSCLICHWESKSCNKNEISDCSERLHSDRQAFRRGTLGPTDQRDNPKRLENGKASCFAFLNRITKLKCVNSEVKSVDSHPQRGCLNWPYGTLSESP